MIAFHSNWTRPFTVKNANKPYAIDDFDLLTMILSALKWREKNGQIKMITDSVGADYYNSLGLAHIWDLGLSTELENAVPKSIDETAFWAAGKLFALKIMGAPCVMLDTDFIVWENIRSHLGDSEISVIHNEPLDSKVYPSQDHFKMTENYFLNKGFDWSVLPCNTALTSIKNQHFLNFYTQCSLNFMEHALKPDDAITYMVFAEQRMLSMCASKLNIPITCLSDIETLFSDTQKKFTHIWGYKRHLKNNLSDRELFCKRCVMRIQSDFPEVGLQLKNIPHIKKYC